MSTITITPAGGTWTIRTGDGVLGESRRAKALAEGSRPPVIYVPREDVAMALLERTATQTRCPHKGVASYYAYVGRSERVEDVAWSYEAVTNPDAKAVEGHLAFYGDKVAIEQL